MKMPYRSGSYILESKFKPGASLDHQFTIDGGLQVPLASLQMNSRPLVT
jgi:hypothetical protein